MPRKAASRKMSKKQSKVRFAGSGAYKKRTFKGSGAYTYSDPGPVGKLGRMIGKGIGMALAAKGGPAAAMGGGIVGEHLGGLAHYPAKFFGSGDYGIRGNAIAPQLPKFENSKDYVTITHREYLGDLITDSTPGETKITSYGLNPSIYKTFPWLSELAQSNFQQFKFDGMIFEYRSFSADALNSTNTALGSVFAAINYDYTDEDLTTRSQIENCDWSSSCKPSESMLIPVECEPKQTGMNGLLYILNIPSVPPTADPKTYYLGKLFIGTTGFQGASVNCGSIYVTYKIRLYKPFLAKPLSNANIVSFYNSGVTNALPFGTAKIDTQFNCDTLGVICSGTQLGISKQNMQPSARYFCMIRWKGASTASLVTPSMTISGPATLLGLFDTGGGVPYTGTIAYYPSTSGVTDFVASILFEFETKRVVNAPILIDLANTGTLPTGSTCQIFLTQRNGNDTAAIGNVPYTN